VTDRSKIVLKVRVYVMRNAIRLGDRADYCHSFIQYARESQKV
jgi:hypothetical protein